MSRARDLADIASTASGGIEGTEVKSTGESGGTKFLREDGDGTCSWQVNEAFPSTTKMLFQQTSAPTGWTKVTSSNDVALRVVSGTVGSGGSVAFETAFASQNIADHTLTVSEMPSHNHTVANPGYQGNGGSTAHGSQYNVGHAGGHWVTSHTGGGGSHNHGSINLDVSYVDVIIASKD